MVRTVLVVLLLLCASGVTAANGVQSSPPSSDVQPTNGNQLSNGSDGSPAAASAANVEMLVLDGPTRTNVTSPSIDVATAVATQREAARTRLDHHSIEVAFERADGEQARRELILQAATDVEIETLELRTDQRALRASYVSGEITTGTFLRRQVVMDSRAGQILADLDSLSDLADRVPRLSMRSRVQSIEASLIGFGGPVTTRSGEVITGERRSARLYVSASANGTAFAMIDGDEYVRESFRSDRWVSDSSEVIDLDEVERLAFGFYPVAINSSQTKGYGFDTVGTGLYQISIRHDQGEIVAHLDGDTREVFYEIQRQPLDLIQPGPAVTETGNGTRLTVNRTFAGGPLRIAAADNSTGEPLDATVHVGGSELRTGSDGVVWVLMPSGETQVTATTEAGTVTLVVDGQASTDQDRSPVTDVVQPVTGERPLP